MSGGSRHGVYLGEDYAPLPSHTHSPSCSHNSPRGIAPVTTYKPALAQTIEGPNHGSTGRMRWARAIYAADGTLLDVIAFDEVAWPEWTEELTKLPPVKVSAGEFKRWMMNAARGPVT